MPVSLESVMGGGGQVVSAPVAGPRVTPQPRSGRPAWIDLAKALSGFQDGYKAKALQDIADEAETGALEAIAAYENPNADVAKAAAAKAIVAGEHPAAWSPVVQRELRGYHYRKVGKAIGQELIRQYNTDTADDEAGRQMGVVRGGSPETVRDWAMATTQSLMKTHGVDPEDPDAIRAFSPEIRRAMASLLNMHTQRQIATDNANFHEMIQNEFADGISHAAADVSAEAASQELPEESEDKPGLGPVPLEWALPTDARINERVATNISTTMTKAHAAGMAGPEVNVMAARAIADQALDRASQGQVDAEDWMDEIAGKVKIGGQFEFSKVVSVNRTLDSYRDNIRSALHQHAVEQNAKNKVLQEDLRFSYVNRATDMMMAGKASGIPALVATVNSDPSLSPEDRFKTISALHQAMTDVSQINAEVDRSKEDPSALSVGVEVLQNMRRNGVLDTLTVTRVATELREKLGKNYSQFLSMGLSMAKDGIGEQDAAWQRTRKFVYNAYAAKVGSSITFDAFGNSHGLSADQLAAVNTRLRVLDAMWNDWRLKPGGEGRDIQTTNRVIGDILTGGIPAGWINIGEFVKGQSEGKAGNPDADIEKMRAATPPAKNVVEVRSPTAGASSAPPDSGASAQATHLAMNLQNSGRNLKNVIGVIGEDAKEGASDLVELSKIAADKAAVYTRKSARSIVDWALSDE